MIEYHCDNCNQTRITLFTIFEDMKVTKCDKCDQHFKVWKTDYYEKMTNLDYARYLLDQMDPPSKEKAYEAILKRLVEDK